MTKYAGLCPFPLHDSRVVRIHMRKTQATMLIKPIKSTCILLLAGDQEWAHEWKYFGVEAQGKSHKSITHNRVRGGPEQPWFLAGHSNYVRHTMTLILDLYLLWLF